MKKIIALVLCLMMLFSAGALAVENSKVQVCDNEEYPMSVAPMVVDGTAWILAQEYKIVGDIDLVLVGWKPGMTEPVRMGKDILKYADSPVVENETKDTVHALCQLFTDGQRLMSLNPHTGLVFEIKTDGENVTFEDIVTLDDISICMDTDNDAIRRWRFLQVQDGMLVAGIETYDPENWNITLSVMTGDLTTGKVKNVNFKLDNAENGCTYKDGKILLTAYGPESSDENTRYMNRVYTLDLETGAVEEKWVMDTFSSAIVYHKGLDALLFMDNQQIRGIKADGTIAEFGYTISDYVEDLAVYDDQSVLCRESKTLYLVGIQDGWQPGVALNVAPYYYLGSMADFLIANPNISVYYNDDSDVTDLLQRMTNGDDSVDVFFVTLSGDKVNFTDYINKGYFTDLSSDQFLMTTVNRMHPIFRDAVMQGDKLCAVPVSVYNSGVTGYYPAVLRDMDIPEEELPRNLVDLCKFIQYYAEEADESGIYSLYEGGMDKDFKAGLLDSLLRQYEYTYQGRGEELTLDTPELREILAQWERLDYDAPSASDTDWKDGLLTQTSILGSFYMYPYSKEMLEDYASVPLGMGLTENATDWYIPTQMTVGFINPNSRHQEEAKAFLRYIVEKLDPNTAYTLYADATEPRLNPDFEDAMKYYRQSAEDYKAAEEAAENEDERENFAQLREALESEMEKYAERYRYSISEKQIEFYLEEVLPRVFLSKPSEMTDKDLIKRYAGGQISAEQFIREMDGKLKMMRLEDR